ncbi:MAG: pirin family protein [Nitrococcus mobilis]|nr:pirin family protein [Nitrococcus mobilis]
MSWRPAQEPEVLPAGCLALEAEIIPRPRDLGGFAVRRVLPAAQRQMIGPFIFFDHMGPAAFEAGQGIDVRPHPHIGLATVTYLFEGELLHRDSLGSMQTIRPGEVNWMSAGRGIVHSERTPTPLRGACSRISGIQSWVALPDEAEEGEPTFAHHGTEELPRLEGEGVRICVIAGALYGKRAPVKTASELFYADATLADRASLILPAEHEERGVYLAEGAIELAGETFEAARLLVFRPDGEIPIHARGSARLLLLGGAAFPSRRYIWWNFVSSTMERIEQAKADWQAGRFEPVPGEHEWISLPE